MTTSASRPTPRVARLVPPRGARATRVLLVLTALLLALAAFPSPASAATAKPSHLQVATVGPSTVSLTWSAVAKAPRYRVKLSTSSAMTHPRYVYTGSAHLTVTALKAGTRYYLKVRVVSVENKALSGYSATVTATTSGAATTGHAAQPLRVGSYNVKCDGCYSGLPNELHWADRRGAVVANILSAHLDVIGVQEAGQAWLKDSSGHPIDLSQFEDLRNRLGSPWALVNDKRHNCVRSTTPNHCVYADQGASQGTRILYDTTRVDLLASGSRLLPTVSTSTTTRYVAWAQLRQRSTGLRFFFADTHLDHEKDSPHSTTYFDLRRRQAEVVAATVAAHNTDHLPTVVVGDLNSSRFPHSYSPTNAPYDVLVKAGYVDPLGGTFNSTTTAPGATVEHRVRTWLSSFNDFTRAAPNHKAWINGSYIDYMFVSPTIEVKEWETVADLDSHGRFVGIIPSDHNLVRETLLLPRG